MTKRYNLKIFKRINQGYTIIETMISVSLFIIIVMMGMNSLLNANVLHKKSQNMRSIMDNLSFIMEDIGRNMRTGTSYHCVVGSDFTGLTTPKSCVSGGAVAFKNSLDGSTWVYKIESQDGGTSFNIYKSTNAGATWVQLNPPEVLINSISGFSVLGAEPPPADLQQPFVTIRLVGKITTQNVVTPFSLQTSVSQRVIDI
jgi:type II secretory pathway pseudopilin PulG